jgi:hypothetical protein
MAALVFAPQQIFQLCEACHTLVAKGSRRPASVPERPALRIVFEPTSETGLTGLRALPPPAVTLDIRRVQHSQKWGKSLVAYPTGAY